jgi:hypothetical protein
LSLPSGDVPTSSVNIATQAGMSVSSSASVTRRTAGSPATSGSVEVASSG